MISALIIAILLLSILCLFVLNKPHLSVLLVVIASNQMSAQASNVIFVILFTAILQFFSTFISEKQNKSFLLILFLPISYILLIFLIQPYKINIYFYEHYLGYLTALFIFAWVALIKWNPKKIVYFLTAYGLYLILGGFIERIFTSNERVGTVLTVATAYAVVLVVTWAVWLINAYLYKVYSLIIILLGTVLVFFAVIFSGTRMGLLGIFLGFVLCGLSIVLMRNKNINIVKIIVYSISIMALVLLLNIGIWNLMPNDLFIKRTFSTLIAGKLDNSNLGRVYLWASAIDIIDKNKTWGIGAGNFPEKSKFFFQSLGISKRIGINTHAHNIYLIMLSEHGIIGFSILMIFAFFCIFRAFRHFLKNRNSSIFFAFFSGFIIMAFLGLVDATPMYMPTAGFAAWFFGVCVNLKIEDEKC